MPDAAAVIALLKSLEALPLPTAVRESDWLFPIIETVHVLALVTVVGTIGRLDLRLSGLLVRGRSVRELTRELLPWTWAAFMVAALSGLLLFSSAASKYAANPYFRAKLLLLTLAGVNMLVFQLGAGRRMAQWPATGVPPNGARVAGLVSLTLWIAVVTAGRWIGYTIH
jgi:hypothetical protein